jgi:hypothetical protein
VPASEQPRIARAGPGRFAISLPRPERLLLRSLLPELRALIEGRDPTTKRLFPVAYPDDPDKEREYQGMMSGELVDSRLAAIETVKSTLSHKDIDSAELERWMEAINSLRLVLGTRLDVTEELPILEPDDPDAAAYAVYDYLGWLLEQAVRAQMEDFSASSES